MNWRQDWDRQQRLESMSLAEYDRMMELDRLFQDLQQGEADYERRTGSMTAAPAFSLRDYLYQGYNRRMGPESARMMFGDGERTGYADWVPVLGGLVPGIDGAIDAATNGLSAGNAMDMGFGALDAVGAGGLARGAGRGLRSLSQRSPDGIYDIPQSAANRQYFADRLREAQASQGPLGRSVDVKGPDDYIGSTMMMTDDGLAGFAVSPGGEINSLVKHTDSPMRGFGQAAAARGSAEGGDWLNAFDTVLPGMYGRAGFEPVSRIGFSEDVARSTMGDEGAEAFMNANSRFNGGRPDLVFMRQTGQPQEVASGVGGRDYGFDYDGAHDAVRASVAGLPDRAPGYDTLKQYIQSQLGR
jgi:hypothetical protein